MQNKIDIFPFINSRDIAEYLKTINYNFSSLQMAWIVWYSKKQSMTKKYKVWQQIVEAYPNEQIVIEGRAIGTLGEIMPKYIDCVKKYLKDFFSTTGGCFSYSYIDCMGEWSTDYHVYLTAKDCLAGNKDRRCRRKGEYFRVERKKFGRWDKLDVVIFNGDGQPVQVDLCCKYGDNDPIFYMFEKMWFAFPTPFEKGDLVIESTNPHYYSKHEWQPFVLDNMGSWAYDGSDKKVAHANRKDTSCLTVSDITVYGYFLNECHSTYSYQRMHDYFNLEYYRKPARNNTRLLLALSSHLKGRVETNAFLTGTRLVKVENELKYAKNQLPHDNLTKTLLGLPNYLDNNWQQEFVKAMKPFPKENGATAFDILKTKVLSRANKRDCSDEYKVQLNEELGTIFTYQLAEAYLLTEKVFNSAKQVCLPLVEGAWCCSCIAYELGLLLNNPLDTNSQYQRLINSKIGTIPNLTLTVPLGHGEKVKKAIGKKYLFFANVVEDDIPFVSAQQAEQYTSNLEIQPQIMKSCAKKYLESPAEIYDMPRSPPSRSYNAFAYTLLNTKEHLKHLPNNCGFTEGYARWLQLYGYSAEESYAVIKKLAQDPSEQEKVLEFIAYYCNKYKLEFPEKEILETCIVVRYSTLDASLANKARFLYLAEYIISQMAE